MSATLNAPDTDWSARGLCVQPGVDSALWFPNKPHSKRREALDAYENAVNEAKAACRACPVLDQCASNILRVQETSYAQGVIAAMTGRERNAARKQRDAQQAAEKRLTTKQRAVLRYRRAGIGNTDIAALMGVTRQAVEAHVAAILRAGHSLEYLRPPTVRGACGTDVGRRTHSRRGERICDVCRTGGKETAA